MPTKTITVPEGFIAVAVLVPKSEKDEPKVVYCGCENDEEPTADEVNDVCSVAIHQLVDAQADVVDELIAELDDGEGGEEEGDDKAEEPS